jgi:hypothetical protein
MIRRQGTVGTKAILSLLLCAALAAGYESPSTGIRFQKEHIKVFVGSKSIRVQGLYTFVNPDPAPRREALFYPIPVDSLHPPQDYVLVRIGNRSIPTKNMEGGVGFGVEVPGSGSLAVEVIYEQTCLDRSGCYILTSTAEWKAPLEHASFEIHVPDSIEIEWMAYDAGAKDAGRKERVYAFSRDDFMPEKDLCLRWRVRGRP